MEPIIILTLQNIPRIGRKSIEKLISEIGSEKINDSNQLRQLIENTKQKYRNISVPDAEIVKNAWEQANEIYEKSIQKGIYIISIFDGKYPTLLKQIKNPPLLLHYKGNIEILNKDSIAIIGTRKPTNYSKERAEYLGFHLAKQNISVVSGLALGVDAAAHKGALKSNGPTVAVLAHGLDTISPKSNKKLAEDIIEKNGLLISEYPIGKKSQKHTFIERNRIQSGLSFGTILVESKGKGGSMKTAEFCKEQNRLLGVVKPPENMVDKDPFQGNAYLMSDSNIEIIEDDGANFIKNLRNSTRNISQKTNLFDFL